MNLLKKITEDTKEISTGKSNWIFMNMINLLLQLFVSLIRYIFDFFWFEGEALNIMCHCLLALLYMQDDGELFESIPLSEVISLIRYM